MVASNSSKFQGFVIDTNCESGTRTLKLLHINGVSRYTYPILRRNGLWFYSYDPTPQPQPTVNQLNNSCLSALWHRRLGCARNNVMDKIHNHVIGIDKPLRINLFYRCPYCLPTKMSKISLKLNAHKNNIKSSTHKPTSDTSFNPL